jgi:anti-sigma factor RsiW
VASCARCDTELSEYRKMRRAMSVPSMSYQAPAGLRRSLAGPPRVVTSAPPSTKGSARRYTLRGFAMGGILSSAIAACLMLFVVQNQEDQRIVGDAISAHLRAVQGQHLMDVVSTDEQAVKPWFNGRLDMAPPVIDLRSLGCALAGGRIDYVNGTPVAAIVYRRGDHVINLFVSQAVKSGGDGTVERVQGLSVWRWARSDLGFVAVSDVSGAELQEFGDQFVAALKARA